uniref:ADP-ribose glycohydrolase MACROD1 n=1 Tax=Panthera onca TaxID=9690 RepID=UPI00295591EE|nr:ADP-ribose glycohydrolase MACROD1 [Panthera onca]
MVGTAEEKELETQGQCPGRRGCPGPPEGRPRGPGPATSLPSPPPQAAGPPATPPLTGFSLSLAANSSLLGGGGVDGCIHRAAGPLLTDECRTLQNCETGKAKITGGYRLPAKYVIHTVGPIAHGEPSASQAAELRSCYLSSLDLLLEHRLRSAAFPCISTGVFGYPSEAAAEIVLAALREWLEQHKDKVDRLIICVFLEKDESIYMQRLPHYFPVDSPGPTGPRSQL